MAGELLQRYDAVLTARRNDARIVSKQVTADMCRLVAVGGEHSYPIAPPRQHLDAMRCAKRTSGKCHRERGVLSFRHALNITPLSSPPRFPSPDTRDNG